MDQSSENTVQHFYGPLKKNLRIFHVIAHNLREWHINAPTTWQRTIVTILFRSIRIDGIGFNVRWKLIQNRSVLLYVFFLSLEWIFFFVVLINFVVETEQIKYTINNTNMLIPQPVFFFDQFIKKETNIFTEHCY